MIFYFIYGDHILEEWKSEMVSEQTNQTERSKMHHIYQNKWFKRFNSIETIFDFSLRCFWIKNSLAWNIVANVKDDFVKLYQNEKLALPLNWNMWLICTVRNFPTKINRKSELLKKYKKFHTILHLICKFHLSS